MPRTRNNSKSASGSARQKVSYRECSSSSDDESNLGMLSTILGLFMQHKATKKRKSSTGRPTKRKQSTNQCEVHCHCCHCNKSGPKRKRVQNRGKGANKAAASTSTKQDDSVELESDDEVENVKVTDSHVDDIKNKVDDFFKALESDDEELEEKNTKKSSTDSPATKNKDFYTILSDSEDEKDEKQTQKGITITDTSTTPVSVPSTSGLDSTLTTGLKMVTNTLNVNPERKTEDLFAYVDDILNECNGVVDISDDKPKENIPVLSLEDLKKRTDEILGGVASLIDDLKPKPEEPEKNTPISPVKEAPSCPVCFEPLGGKRQAMATLCGHMFCETCLLQVVKTTKKCPSCRKGLTKTKYHPVYI